MTVKKRSRKSKLPKYLTKQELESFSRSLPIFNFKNSKIPNIKHENPAHPKNWSKFKFFKPWTMKGLLGTVGFLEQAPGGTLRGATKPKINNKNK